MDLRLQSARSLPPLVEGKTHGYLNFSIDEIVWNRRTPGNVSILVCWWGELDNAQLKPVDLKSDDATDKITTESYAIKTNFDLFKQYLKNSETVELLVISEKSHHVIGTAIVKDLLEILSGKDCMHYYSIFNDNEYKIGDIHVTMKLTSIHKAGKSSSKLEEEKPNLRKLPIERPINSCSNILLDRSQFNIKGTAYEPMPLGDRNIGQSDNMYHSILRDKRSDINNLSAKVNFGVTDKLVAQVVARAQRLRGAMLHDTNDDDPLIISDNSTLDSFRSEKSVENEAALYEYFMGKQMSRRNEKKALETLRSQSPTPSLIDFAAETIRSCHDNIAVPSDLNINLKENHIEDAHQEIPMSTNRLSIQQKEACPIDHVDSLRIVVDSLTLNDAGYRRVRSSCMSRGDGVPISVTYFVQYDAMFGYIKKLNKKSFSGSKLVKMCSKRQDGHVIHFNHEAVYDLPKSYLHVDSPLKFRVFHRHLNQRTPTELGVGSMYVSDAARSSSLSATQRLAIVKKGIKIGELHVTAELGCDKIHFGKHFVEAVTSAKENIPVLELTSNSSAVSQRHKTTTGGESKSNSRSSAPERRENTWMSMSHSNSTRKSNESNQPSEERIIQMNASSSSHEKILLHGLIYIGEGKDLLHTNTYLLCRAFWREDRALSRVCRDTANPLYRFHQLVPLIHGLELLERTKDNCIITEVYAKNPTGADSLLGIAKLSVHQLYIAYRDPLVLPHLLKSKYPVISVDGWVSITDPITGRLCGQLLALVALGTADQIALLEMTRGLRDPPVTRRNFEINAAVHSSQNDLPTTNGAQQCHSSDFDHQLDRDESPTIKTQECQTEITTVSDLKSHRPDDIHSNSEDATVLHAIVDRLALALSAPRTITDQGTQFEMDIRTREPPEKIPKARNIEPLCLDASHSNIFSGDSSNNSPRENFNMPQEIFRSVGVGAEFDEPIPQVSNTYDDNGATGTSSNPQLAADSERDFEVTRGNSSAKLQLVANEENDLDISNSESASFRAIVEIECALHLPKIELADESVQPCTYVTFQKFRSNASDRIGSYLMTDVCPYSCNPKYDWRCDTSLSTDLLLNEEKRLIMKVWRLVEPEMSMKINLEKDVVIGFSAVDLSVLTAGFPMVSGWFHIMDFLGKCNGQMKVSVTPLDNIATLGKYHVAPSRSAIPPFDHSNFSSPYPQDLEKVEKGNTASAEQRNLEEVHVDSDQANGEPSMEIGLGLGDASMSFLSHSLKQKLSELDVIKKRLESRLQDITSAAFDDEFDEFDLPEQDNGGPDNENNGNDSIALQNSASWLNQPVDNLPSGRHTNADRTTNGNHCSASESEQNYPPPTVSDINTSSIDTGYSSGNLHSGPTLMNGSHNLDQRENQTLRRRAEKSNANDNNLQMRIFNSNINGHGSVNPRDSKIINCQVNDYGTRNSKPGENSHAATTANSNDNNSITDNHYLDPDNPSRGTRMHINHLLDQLSTQLTAAPPPITSLPMKRNIMDLISTLRRNNNNFPNDVKCNREANVRTVPTQTEANHTGNTRSSNHSTESINDLSQYERDFGRDDSAVPAKRREKISTVIREELVSDDNDSPDLDFLSAHLMTSNVRHMGVSNMLNPLLYPHILPDISIPDSEIMQQQSACPSVSPEGEAIENLDSRYTETFTEKINKGLGRLRDLTDMESRITPRFPSALEHAEAFRVTPSGVFENIDGNIDVTVVHKPCNDDLMASNSVESTITTSSDNGMQTVTEIDDNSSLNSSETSVSAISRQAPDGGNPAEDPGKTYITNRNNYSQDSSSSSN